MIPLERIDRFRQQSARADTIQALGALLSSEIVNLGFERFAYVALKRPNDRPGRLYFGTYPPEWAAFYRDRNLSLHDPVMQHTYASVQPYLWEDVARATDDPASERLVFGPAADVGLRTGAAVPIHGPAGGLALLAVSNDCPAARFAALFAVQRYALQTVAYVAHDAIVRLASPAESNDPPLTARQKEVLLWAVLGKTNWEIGEILGIAEDTVRQHVRLVCQTLGATNRTQAAAIAINRNLIPAINARTDGLPSE